MSGSYRALIDNWERLLAAVRASEAEFPALAALRVELEGQLEALKATKARQLSLQADHRVATQQIQEILCDGLDKARRLRSQVKGFLGLRDPRLRVFGITPLGKREPYGKPRSLSLPWQAE
jgi:hypothetical protein